MSLPESSPPTPKEQWLSIIDRVFTYAVPPTYVTDGVNYFCASYRMTIGPGVIWIRGTSSKYPESLDVTHLLPADLPHGEYRLEFTRACTHGKPFNRRFYYGKPTALFTSKAGPGNCLTYLAEIYREGD